MRTKLLITLLLSTLCLSSSFAQRGATGVEKTAELSKKIKRLVNNNMDQLSRRKNRALVRSVNQQLSMILADLQDAVMVDPIVEANRVCPNESFDSDIISCYQNLLGGAEEQSARQVLKVCRGSDADCYVAATRLIARNKQATKLEIVKTGCMALTFSSDQARCLENGLNRLNFSSPSVDVMVRACTAAGDSDCFVEGLASVSNGARPAAVVTRACSATFGSSKTSCLRAGVEAIGRYDNRYAKVAIACGRLNGFSAERCYETALSNLR
jgi:hypothetical protein